VKHRRLLLYSLFYLLTFVGGLSLPYWLIVLVAGSKLAAYVLGFSILLITPTMFVSFYWGWRSEFRPFTITPEEYKSVSRSSTLVAISSSFLICGTLIFQNGWRVAGGLALATHALLMVCHVRLLWQSKRQTHERLIERTKSTGVPSSVIRMQRKQWIPIVAISLAVQAFGWSGLYLIFRGSAILGAVLCLIAGLLCAPLLRMVQRTVVKDATVT
jgi:hypothetical protein